MAFIANTARAISMTIALTGKSWMWIGAVGPVARRRPLPGIGYFASTERNRRGRQLGRVLASRYHEVVTDRLFAGNRQLGGALHPLVEAAERTLELSEAKRQHCLVRFD